MSEIEEIKEMMRETGAKPPKRKIGKRGKIAMVATVLVIAILLGAYIAMTLPASEEKYWKPQKEFQMPYVDWSNMKSSYVVNRTTYDQDGTDAPCINKTIGSEKSNGNFKVEIVVDVKDYSYYPHGPDEIHTMFYVSFTKLGGNYIVKDLIFKFEPSDNDVRTPSFDDYYFAANNLYFTADVGNYPTPYGAVSDRMDYELWTLHQIRGVNKDVKNIKDGGFSNSFQISLYDNYPHWVNHTIRFTATLEYGQLTIFGWQDMHKLSASIVIYVVPEGGE